MSIKHITIDYYVCCYGHHHTEFDKAERCEIQKANKKVKKRFAYLLNDNWESLRSTCNLLGSLGVITEHVEHGINKYGYSWERRRGDRIEAVDFFKRHNIRVMPLVPNRPNTHLMVSTDDLKNVLTQLGKMTEFEPPNDKKVKV